MPNIKMIKRKVSQVQINAATLVSGENELKLNFSFSMMLPNEREKENEGLARIEFDAITKNEKKFLSVTYDATFAFSSKVLDRSTKMTILENEGFPETYSIFCEYLNNLMEISLLKKLLLPDYRNLR